MEFKQGEKASRVLEVELKSIVDVSAIDLYEAGHEGPPSVVIDYSESALALLSVTLVPVRFKDV